MSTPLLLKDTATSVVVYLESSATGLGATGLTYADVTAGLKKEGGSFAVLPLDAANFVELSDGFYEVALKATDTDVLGSLYVSFVGPTIKNALVVARVANAAAAVPQPSPGYTPAISTLFGYIYSLTGEVMPDVSVVARIVSMPTLMHPVDQGIVIGADIVRVLSDAVGFFSLSLVAGATVEILIPAVNYRRTILVPATNTNLFDMP